jgi:Holliday junction resolvase
VLEGKGGVRELVNRLKELDAEVSDAGREEVTLDREDVERLVDFVEKAVAAAERANELLVHSYSMPDDERGVRFISEDAVKLQWALREIGIGDDSGQPCFTV